ncbi:Ig-like domain-containing protein, partial [Motilimonas eburnea]|uniref:Ig-like domain-containing protein n=1 Tax=Motilimonas eburnea TaxID=1737488 RepID=UPI001E2AD945
MKTKPFAITILCGACFTANAEILEYEFTDTNNRVVVRGADLPYLNPVNNMEVTVSAGLDRIIRVTSFRGSKQLGQKTSQIVGINDRLATSDGKEFYGKRFVLPVSSDGDHRIVQETFDTSMKLIKREEKSFVRDTVGPEITGQMTVRRRHGSTGSINNFGTGGLIKDIFLPGVTSDIAPVKSAVFFTEEQGIQRTVSAPYNSTDASLSVSIGAAANSSMAPKTGTYHVGFIVEDEAGNTTKIEQESIISNNVPELLPQVLNKQTNKWEDYQSGMKIYQQPVTMRWRMRKADHTSFNNSQIGWTAGQYSYEEGDYLYREVTFSYPQRYSYFYQYTASGGYRAIHYANYDFTLAEGVEYGPKATSVQCQITTSAGWRSCTIEENKPYTLTDVRVFVAKRSYTQSVVVSSFGSCYVPVGKEFCDISGSMAFTEGRGYVPLAYTSAYEDGSYRVTTSHILNIWDFNEPIIESTSITDGIVNMRVVDQDAVNTWNSHMWQVDKFNAVAKKGANTVTVPFIKRDRLDYKTHDVQFDTRSLADGDYEIVVSATDRHGNVATKSAGNLLIDNTPPSIAVFAENKAIVDGQTVLGLESISIKLSDLHGPDITEVNISGGPISDSIYLDWVKLDGTNFKLEYPRIFPSL